MKYFPKQPKTALTKLTKPKKTHFFSRKCLETALTKLTKLGYSSLALGKISKLALVGYEYLAHTVRLKGFFCMRNISMRSHVMAELEGDTFECASYLDYWSTNPLQLCHLNYLVVIGRASKLNLGAHTHA